MALKKAQTKISLDDSPEIRSVSYRIEHIDQFGWQGYRITVDQNGSAKEEVFYKKDLFNLVMGKIMEVMKSEGHVKYALDKAKNA